VSPHARRRRLHGTSGAGVWWARSSALPRHRDRGRGVREAPRRCCRRAATAVRSRGCVCTTGGSCGRSGAASVVGAGVGGRQRGWGWGRVHGSGWGRGVGVGVHAGRVLSRIHVHSWGHADAEWPAQARATQAGASRPQRPAANKTHADLGKVAPRPTHPLPLSLLERRGRGRGGGGGGLCDGDCDEYRSVPAASRRRLRPRVGAPSAPAASPPAPPLLPAASPKLDGA
jgi:hypothetical protein